MILLANFFIATANLLGGLISIFIFLFIARAILSWVNPDPRNPIVQFLYGSTEPVLRKVRSKIPPMGMFDISIVVIILGLYFIDQFLVASLRTYGQMMLK
ncbi:YggT family protein [bacterium]|nr:YggT family protein [bacterium]